jgi:hypothetical protein
MLDHIFLHRTQRGCELELLSWHKKYTDLVPLDQSKSPQGCESFMSTVYLCKSAHTWRKAEQPGSRYQVLLKYSLRSTLETNVVSHGLEDDDVCSGGRKKLSSACSFSERTYLSFPTTSLYLTSTLEF